jgi:hypothetical protein
MKNKKSKEGILRQTAYLKPFNTSFNDDEVIIEQCDSPRMWSLRTSDDRNKDV